MTESAVVVLLIAAHLVIEALFLILLTLLMTVVYLRSRKSIKGVLALHEQMVASAKLVHEGVDAWKMAPSIMEGHVKIANANVAELRRLTKAVDKISVLFAESNAEDKPEFIPADEAQAAKLFEVRSLMEQRPELDEGTAENIVDGANSFYFDPLGRE